MNREAGLAPVATGRFAPDADNTAVLDIVLDAARRIGAAGIGDLEHTRPVVLPDTWQVLAGPLAADGRRAVEVQVRRAENWVTCATGELTDDPTADGRDGFVTGTADWPARSLADAIQRDGLVPVRWRDVEVLPTAARADVVWTGDRARVWFADREGSPAGYIDEVTMGLLDAEAVPVEHVYRMTYHEVTPTPRAAAPDRVVVDLTGSAGPIETTLAALTHMWLDVRDLVFLIDDGLACAPVRGLVRSLRAERPEWTVRLIEIRPGAAPETVATALDAADPDLVVTGTKILEPRLTPAAITGTTVPLVHSHPPSHPELSVPRETMESGAGGKPLDRNGTALITGGTGELGRLMATHLVAGHGIRHLVLVSRRGPDAPGAADLVAELKAAGARSVRVLAADVTDRAQVASVLSAVDPRHPLTAVLHLAGVIDPRLVSGQDAARFTRVLAPKIDGAWHLHELTRDRPLAAFVLFSSVASVFGSAGQSNYAAANAFLDALAEHRRATGLVATSVSWGWWAGSGMSSYLGDAEVARLARQGIRALTASQGRRIFDAAIAQNAPHLVAAVLTPPATVTPEPLALLPDEDRWRSAVALVRREVAVVLGAEVGPRQVLGDAGVDSLMALELRTRLTAATSVPLPATLAVDHPTPHAIARLIVARLAPAPPRLPTIGVSGAAAGVSTPETVWAALEHAGVVPKSLRGRRVGVFMGARSGDVAGRVAELFELRGPTVTVCGSPLTAVHLARTALLREECELALAGGDGVVVLGPLSTSDRAVLVDSVLEGAGGDGMAELVAAVLAGRRTEVRGQGARLVVEPHDPLPANLHESPIGASGGPPISTLPESTDNSVGRSMVPVLVSGHDPDALRRQAARWADWLTAHPDVSLAAVARTAAVHRTHFVLRACVLASSVGDAVAGLRALADGTPDDRVVQGVAERKDRLVFACAGHTGRCVTPRLLQDNEVFSRTAAQCEAVLRPLLGWSVVDALVGDNELDLDHPDVARSALFVAQVSLAAALRDLGFVPDHTFGTIAAEVIAGRCSLEDGARIVVEGSAESTEPVGVGDEVVPLSGAVGALMRVLGTAHVHGYAVDWAAALPAGGLVDLPPYPFAPVDPAGVIQWALRVMETATALTFDENLR
jgi:NADP-dependent 3-hydroxy acid dehydrogenase YdfG